MFLNEFAAKGLVDPRVIERTTYINPNCLLGEGTFAIFDLSTRLRINEHNLKTSPEEIGAQYTATGLFVIRSISKSHTITSTAPSHPQINDETYTSSISIQARGLFSYTPHESYNLEYVDERLLDGRTIRLPNAMLTIEDFNREKANTVHIRSSQFFPGPE